jgi:uncharacterized membrane protein YeaQ/YmgE (transglycosylase-associated protein family)
MPSSLLLTAVQIGGISLWDLRAHSVWSWAFVGLVVGWMGGIAFRGQGRSGCITDIVLGLIGGVGGGWLFNYFNILNGDFLYSLGAAALGALLLVALARFFGGEPKK